MITLKDYQERVLESLREFFRLAAHHRDPSFAFREVTRRTFQESVPYLQNPSDLNTRMPYVCLRVPTGGGKTLLACYAAGLAKNELLHAEHTVVLWLVPSNTILEQTADALRDPRHPYRRALELACGAVEVVTIEEALRLSRATVDGQTVIIVATIQSFRVEDTTGRKVYAQNGAFAEHLLNVTANRVTDLLPGADGKPLPSLVNMLRLRRPVVIVDEAHNARTDLSFATLAKVMPSCIIEFTATPARQGHPSNVLHHVSAAELKAADMIKLPLRVVSRHPGQRDQLLAEAITLRGDLEKLALVESQQTGEYLRPIMLIQAERVDGCEPLRERLINDFGLDREQIKISVGALDELKEVKDIASPKCPVRFIITVQKLREGWDCPFAYVLCSLRETRSPTAIEQIVGRIMRLPNASVKQHPDLNCAYAFSVSDSLPDVLNELREALESNGFTKVEAERIIIPTPQGVLPLGLQPRTFKFDPVEINTETAEAELKNFAGKVRINTVNGEITVIVPLDEEETKKLVSCVKSPEAKSRVREMVELVQEAEKAFGGTGATRMPTPYELCMDFAVPMLCIDANGNLFEFESTDLMEHEWKLSEKDASLATGYNPLQRPAGAAGFLDVGREGEVQTTVIGETDSNFINTLHQHVLDLGIKGDWSLEMLVVWLDRHIEHKDIPDYEAASFILNAVRGLMVKYNISDLNALVLDRFRLRDEIANRIQEHRATERKVAFRQLLLPDSALTVSSERVINFKSMLYEPSWLYDGGFQFRKHYYGPRPGELKEKKQDGELTEEFKCAQFVDGLPAVKFWVRNLARKSGSFRLQTTSDWFYPDFVCQLNDGRMLVVEYKGKDRYTTDDAEEKRTIGAVWAARSNDHCLFAMPTGEDFSMITSQIRSVS